MTVVSIIKQRIRLVKRESGKERFVEKTARKKKAAATKENIFSTAVGLIKEQGYANVTVSEICRRAGIAKGTFYVHYASKEDIVRESYYSDMGKFVLRGYDLFLEQFPNSRAGDRILCFLSLELAFAEYTGYELTCLAYALNLGACVPGPSEHLERRTFSQVLYQEIAGYMDEALADLSAGEAFTYLESVVRGIMATWCFSNRAFRIEEEGTAFLACAVKGLFPIAPSAEDLPAPR